MWLTAYEQYKKYYLILSIIILLDTEEKAQGSNVIATFIILGYYYSI